MIAQFSSLLSAALITLIRGYQRTLSFDHGPLRRIFPQGFCRFHPSCSQYAIDSINRHGPLRGSLRATGRVLRCNPFSKGGFDPPTDKE